MLLEGYDFRQKRDEALAAYFVVNLMNLSGKSLKRPMKVETLLKPLRPEKPRTTDPNTEKEQFINNFSKG